MTCSMEIERIGEWVFCLGNDAKFAKNKVAKWNCFYENRDYVAVVCKNALFGIYLYTQKIQMTKKVYIFLCTY